MTDPGEKLHVGTVNQWHKDDGWGVIDSVSLDGLVWVHYSSIDFSSRGVEQANGFRFLFLGDKVQFAVERAEQDGFHLRATWVRSIEGEIANNEENGT